MRVKLCKRCPYEPRDLAGHYDPDAALHLCAKCDGEPWMLTNHYPRDCYRRGPCPTNRDVFEPALRSVVRSATKTLVSSATTLTKQRFVQKNASIASIAAWRPTAHGSVGFGPPDRSCIESDLEPTTSAGPR
jgi:hypothetical protein